MRHHYRRTLGGLAALTLLLGCDQGSSVSPSETSAANASRSRPWKESYQSSGTIAPGARCPAPLLLVSLQGGGTATHIGKYTITNSHCVDPVTGALTDGSFVKTAANGDQIVGTYVGSTTVIQPPSPVGIFGINGTITFTGGTGRFGGATGTTSMAGTLEADFSRAPVPAQVSLEMVGTISY
jgi:hypothetical protein